MPQFDILVNWSESQGFHRDARPGDVVNLFGANTPVIREIGSTIAEGTENSFLLSDPDRARFAARQFTRLTSGVGLNNGASIGFNGLSTYDLAAQPPGLYTGVVWVNAASGIPMRLRLRSSAGILATTAFTGSGTSWQKISVTGTLGATLPLYLELTKDNNAVNITLDIAAAMIVVGDSAPGFNSGATSLYDNISGWAKDANWKSGFSQAYRHVADSGHLRVTLRDEQSIFCPEVATSPLYGLLEPRRYVAVLATDPLLAEPAVMWTGFISAIRPSATDAGAPECVIECVDLRALAEGRTVRTAVQVNKSAYQIAVQVHSLLDLPNMTFSGMAFGIPQSWEEIYPYALDAAHRDEADAVRILADCAGAMQAKLSYSTRQLFSSNFDWRFAHELTTSAVAIALDQQRLQDAAYQYGASVINDSTVVARKRKVSAATNKVLYDIEEAIELEPKEEQVIRARFKDNDLEDDRTVSGLDTYLEYTADGGVTASITETFASGVEIKIVNSSGRTRTVSALKIRGKKLTAWGETEHKAVNSASLSSYGVRAELLDYRLPQNRKLAQRTAEYRVSRFGSAFGEVTSVTLKTLEGDDTLRQAMLTLGVFDPVAIDTSSRNGHADRYTIIGEEHRLEDGLGGWTVTWQVEKMYPFFVLDDPVYGLLDAGNRLSLY